MSTNKVSKLPLLGFFCWGNFLKFCKGRMSKNALQISPKSAKILPLRISSNLTPVMLRNTALSPRGPKKQPQTARRNKDRTKAIPRPSWTAPRVDLPSSAAPPGLHLGVQNVSKTDPKTIKNRSENSRDQKSDPRRSWTHLGTILGRLGCRLGPTWTSESCSGCSGARFSENSLFRS